MVHTPRLFNRLHGNCIHLHNSGHGKALRSGNGRLSCLYGNTAQLKLRRFAEIALVQLCGIALDFLVQRLHCREFVDTVIFSRYLLASP